MPDFSKGSIACCKGSRRNGFREHADGCPLGEAFKELKKGRPMLKGSNELRMNQTTMIEAVQCYLATQFKDNCVPVVEHVTAKNDGHSGEGFVVKLKEPEPQGEPAK